MTSAPDPIPRDPAQATLIVSPLASRLRDASTRARIVHGATEALRARGHEVISTIETGDPAAIRGAAEQAVRSGASLVAVAGGDGTVRDAVGALSGTGVTLGLIPGGTGNLYATAVGVPRDLDAAVAALASGAPVPFDSGEVRLIPPLKSGGMRDDAAGDDRAGGDAAGSEGAWATALPFVVACGTGFDARMIAATSRESKRRYGVAAYFLSASRLLQHLRPLPMILTIDGVRTELESVVVLVANCGEAIPGRLRPRLPIEPDDGLLHVFVLPRGGVIGGIRGALELMTAEAAGISPSGAARMTGTRVRVEVLPPGPTQIDGDPFAVASLDARIRPGGLAILRA
jgi:diacylglycerol kinase (ATP)